MEEDHKRKRVYNLKKIYKMGEHTNLFMIGTLKNPVDLDSHAWGKKWTVNTINQWVASLGQKLNPKNAIHLHLIIILHELTHIMSNIKHRDRNDTTLEIYDWDNFLDRILSSIS